MSEGVTIASNATALITDDDIVTYPPGHPQAGMPAYDWGQVPQPINVVDINFDYNVLGIRQGDFGHRLLYKAGLSVDRHGVQRALTVNLRGLRTADNGVAISDDLALRITQRFGFPVWLLRVSLSYRIGHMIEPSDTVYLTSALIEHPITGEIGLDRASFEVLSVQTFFGFTRHTDLLLLATGFIETSAAPTSQLVNLVPGLVNVDSTDISIPFGGSVTVTTQQAVRQFRIGLKRQTYRLWHCQFTPKIFEAVTETCIDGPPSFINRSYTGSINYRVLYRTSGAPNALGIGSDPTTGFVLVPGFTWPQTRGSGPALFASADCQAGDVHPAVPAEDFWSLFVDPNRNPDQYVVQIVYDSVTTQGDPCAGVGLYLCNNIQCQPLTGLDAPATLVASVLHQNVATLTVDYVESIT